MSLRMPLRASAVHDRSCNASRTWRRLRQVSHRGGPEHGVALVEFALILPVLALMLFGMLDFGKAFNYWIDETHLANEGARWAVVNKNPASSGTLQAYIRDQGDDAGAAERGNALARGSASRLHRLPERDVECRRSGPRHPDGDLSLARPDHVRNEPHGDHDHRLRDHAPRGAPDELCRGMRMNALQSVGHSVASERGAVLPWFVLWLPVLVLFMVFVVDVGHWFEHKRHLQLQADAGALAGGGVFTIPCSNASVEDMARKYAGDPNATAPYNAQVPPTDPANVHVLINSTAYWNEGGTDYSDGADLRRKDGRRQDHRVRPASVLPDSGTVRVGRRDQRARSGTGPGAQLPRRRRASHRRPRRGSEPGQGYVHRRGDGRGARDHPVDENGSRQRPSIWDNAAAPSPFRFRRRKSGSESPSAAASSTTCGDPLVDCYDTGSANGLVYIRGWSSTGTGGPPKPPLARNVTLIPGTCPDPYFSSAIATCTIGVSAAVDFGACRRRRRS